MAGRSILRVAGLAALILASSSAGIVAASLSPGIQGLVVTAKREVREALGLPKQWVELVPVDEAARPPEVPCPAAADSLWVVTGGQSNAANSNSSALPAASDRAFMFYDGACHRLADPVLGASGTGGSLWVELGDRLAERLDRDVVLVATAVGGTQFGDWLDERSGYLAAFARRVEEARAHGLRDPLVLWHQGETDAAVVSDFAAFEREVVALLGRIGEVAPDARIYLYQASLCTGAARADGVAGITDALRSAAGQVEGVVAGVDTDQFGADFRSDGCHFNSLGRRAVVEASLPGLTRLAEAGRAGE